MPDAPPNRPIGRRRTTGGIHMSRRIAVLTAVLAAAGLAAAAFSVDSGRAQEQGRTIKIVEGETAGAVIDAKPKGIGRGKGSLGDQFTIAGPVRRDDGARGHIKGTYTIG